jgi:hypothetical protein
MFSPTALLKRPPILRSVIYSEIPSVLAAMIKSFLCKPLILGVHH